MVAKLKLRTRNSQQKRKETKVKERKDVTRLGGFSSHRGVKLQLACRPEHAQRALKKQWQNAKAKREVRRRRGGLMVS